MTPRLLCILLIAAPMSAGCHHVYFYETNKASLTVEARPDPTSPVTGSLGLKQRVVAIVPPTDPTEVQSPKDRTQEAETAAAVKKAATDLEQNPNDPVKQLEFKQAAAQALATHGDAMSVLSTFRFRKHPRTQGQVFSRVSIDGALITGNAAIAVASPREATNAIRALSGTDVAPAALYRRAAVQNIVTGLKQLPDERAQVLLADLNKLASQVPQSYPVPIYDLANPTTLQLSTEPSTVPGAGIDKLTRYQSMLAYTEDNISRFLEELRANRQVELVRGAQRRTLAPGAPDRATVDAQLSAELKRAAEARQRMEQQFVTSPAYRAAARYLLGL